MARHLIIHGHFYQPPRENPWLGRSEKIDTHVARSVKGFNDLVDLQCYTANSLAYVLKDGQVKLVNNYSNMSFNIGPTLMSWLEQTNFGTYQRIIQGDFESQERNGGHGNALAQVFNHVIMPLADRRDKLTQMYWGMAAFEKTYGRKPESIWLAEAAIDEETVGCLVEVGMKFVLSPARTARRIRPIGGGDWQDVNEWSIDTSRPYVIKVPQGELAVFFFDPYYYQHIGGMFKDTGKFINSLNERYPDRGQDIVVPICTDGELYGHWESYGERFLAYLQTETCKDAGITVTNFGKYLADHPPQYEVQIVSQSSWSCPHGVERWRSNCGCSDEQPGLQEYRTPMREALNKLADDLYQIYHHQTHRFLKDPLQARHDLYSVKPGDEASEIAFLEKHLRDDAKPISVGVRRIIMNLLESQRFAQMMLTSCGWFFWDISRPEPLKNLQYAARAIEYLQSTDLIAQVEEPFMATLEKAISRGVNGMTGKTLYQREARYTAPKYRDEMEEVEYTGGMLLKVPCDLTGNVSERFQWQLRGMISRGVKELMIDFNEVDYMDNYAVSAIMTVIPVLKNRGGRLRIYRARNNIVEIFQAAHLSDLVDVAVETAGWKM